MYCEKRKSPRGRARDLSSHLYCKKRGGLGCDGDARHSGVAGGVRAVLRVQAESCLGQDSMQSGRGLQRRRRATSLSARRAAAAVTGAEWCLLAEKESVDKEQASSVHECEIT